jgi:hypothetical protein
MAARPIRPNNLNMVASLGREIAAEADVGTAGTTERLLNREAFGMHGKLGKFLRRKLELGFRCALGPESAEAGMSIVHPKLAAPLEDCPASARAPHTSHTHATAKFDSPLSLCGRILTLQNANLRRSSNLNQWFNIDAWDD